MEIINITKYLDKNDYMDILNLDKSMNPSKETVEKNYKDLLNNIEEENLDEDEKKHKNKCTYRSYFQEVPR